MEKITITIIVVLFGLFAKAQNDTTKYEVLVDNPYSIPKIHLELTPVYDYFSQQNLLVIGFGVGLSGTIANKLKFSASFYRPYFTKFFDINVMDKSSNFIISHPKDNNIFYKLKTPMYYNIDAGIGFIITDKSKTKDETIKLDSRKEYRFNRETETITVTSIPTKVRKIFAIRAGYYSYQTNSNILKDLSKDEYFLTENDDKVFSRGIGYADIDYAKLNNTSENYSLIPNITTAMITQAIYLGVELDAITNIIIKDKNYGTVANSKSSKFYADVFVGKTFVKFQHLKSNTSATEYGNEIGTDLIDYKITKIKNNNLGFRIGWVSQGLLPAFKRNKEIGKYLKHNSGFKVEAGYLPSYNSNFFATFTYYFSFNF